MAVEEEIMARLNESFKEKQALVAKRKRAADKEKQKIAKMVEEDRQKHAELLKSDAAAQLRKKMWEVEQARLKEEENMSAEEKERRRMRLEKKARLKIKAKDAYQQKLAAAAQAEEERRQRVEEANKAARGITADIPLGEAPLIDKDKNLSVADMEDMKRRKEEKERNMRHTQADVSGAEIEKELATKRDMSRSKLIRRLTMRQSVKEESFDDSSATESESSKILSESEKALAEINARSDVALQHHLVSLASAEEEGRSNTKRRVDILKRKKKVKQRFTSVISRVSLMAKFGATYDGSIDDMGEEGAGDDERDDEDSGAIAEESDSGNDAVNIGQGNRAPMIVPASQGASDPQPPPPQQQQAFDRSYDLSDDD